MDFKSFLAHIYERNEQQLGGVDSQFKMAPELRKKYNLESIDKRNPKASAVLVLFYPDKKNKTRLLLTERAPYKGVHSSQISFPGGKRELSDVNLQQTALRETFEETGIIAKDIKIERALTKTYIPPSNFWVSPFLGTLNYTPKFIANEEVKTILEISFDDLINETNLTTKILKTSYMDKIDVPCFKFDEHIVWGATAMILSEVKDLLKVY